MRFGVAGVAYLISHYNVWGTGDGDMAHNWFGGSLLAWSTRFSGSAASFE